MKDDANPYQSPATEGIADTRTEANRLLFIWVWLFTASLGAMFATPADLVSITLAKLFFLAVFLIGVLWGSGLSPVTRWILVCVCLTIAGIIAVDLWRSASSDLIAIALMLAVACVILGFKSILGVVHRRLGIFSALSISYIIGCLYGPLGVLILTVPTVLVVSYAPRSSD